MIDRRYLEEWRRFLRMGEGEGETDEQLARRILDRVEQVIMRPEE